MIVTKKELSPTIEEVQHLGTIIPFYLPLPGGQSNYHRSQATIRWLFGGNKSGKTFSAMVDLGMVALDVHPFREIKKSGVIWVCSETWEMVRDNLWEHYLSDILPPEQITNIKMDRDIPKKIYLRNGHTIEFKAFSQGRELFQSRDIDAVYCDEQCLRDFKGIFDEIQARLLLRKGFLSWSMTPIVPQVELEERIENLPDTDETFYLDLNDNRKSRGGYIEDKRIDDLISEWPEEIRITREKGKFSSYYGTVYQGFDRSIHVVDPFQIPDSWPRYRGIDFGFVNPFVCIWAAKDKDENWYIYREYYKAKTGIQEHIFNIKELSGNEEYVSTIADPENPENREEMRKAGIPTIAAEKSIASGIEMVQSKLKKKQNGYPSLFVFSNCKNVIREFIVYSYPKNSKSDKPLAENDHCMDVIRYIIYTVSKPKKKGRIVIAG